MRMRRAKLKIICRFIAALPDGRFETFWSLFDEVYNNTCVPCVYTCDLQRVSGKIRGGRVQKFRVRITSLLVFTLFFFFFFQRGRGRDGGIKMTVSAAGAR